MNWKNIVGMYLGMGVWVKSALPDHGLDVVLGWPIYVGYALDEMRRRGAKNDMNDKLGKALDEAIAAAEGDGGVADASEA